MAGGKRSIAISLGGLVLLMACLVALLVGIEGAQATAQGQPAGSGNFLGVASCGGTTCHGRSVANTPDMGVVRQDEILIWQDPASAAGAHSRAFSVLQEPRSRLIAQRLGLGEATSARACLGCHATPAPAVRHGPRFLTSDGVSCESCHGAASPWMAYHVSAGATREGNLARGMTPLEDPRARAAVCLDCHFGNRDENRFVTHRIMAAGHPRISFELDLFTTLQAHHDEDQDYRQRKRTVSNVQMWAIGQAMALERSLTLFAETPRGSQGVFPEFYFLDCHSCHRSIQDGPQQVNNLTVEDNPGRPITLGMPPYNDENMIMLSAAARVVAPDLGRRFDESSRAFHAAMTKNNGNVRAAADRLKRDAQALAARFSAAPISDAQVFQIIDTITSQAISARFTDYAGSVQAVMATDTLLSALVATGTVTADQVQAIRADINAAYQAVRDPNAYRPRNFRASLGRAAAAIRRLR
jgi:hypothetical protein